MQGREDKIGVRELCFRTFAVIRVTDHVQGPTRLNGRHALTHCFELPIQRPELHQVYRPVDPHSND